MLTGAWGGSCTAAHQGLTSGCWLLANFPQWPWPIGNRRHYPTLGKGQAAEGRLAAQALLPPHLPNVIYPTTQRRLRMSRPLLDLSGGWFSFYAVAATVSACAAPVCRARAATSSGMSLWPLSRRKLLSATSIPAAVHRRAIEASFQFFTFR